jgi:hypothetical protein
MLAAAQHAQSGRIWLTANVNVWVDRFSMATNVNVRVDRFSMATNVDVQAIRFGSTAYVRIHVRMVRFWWATNVAHPAHLESKCLQGQTFAKTSRRAALQE